MNNSIFKLSAIHNLRITSVKNDFKSNEISEGLVVPEWILELADILPWEQIIVTKIKGNNWINRIKTFVIPGKKNNEVEARGSLSKFLEKGELVCIITRTLLSEKEIRIYKNNQLPFFDLGFDPLKNKDNSIIPKLNIEYRTKKYGNVKNFVLPKEKRKKLGRFFLSSLVLNLKVNKTHSNCLQGSAEFPEDIMKKADIKKYQSVTVYNFSKGGAADTYAVPTPPGVVLTTGAMAKFAKKGDKVNVAAYKFSMSKNIFPKIIFTDGLRCLER
jgi:aspartate 1-decarboxylase